MYDKYPQITFAIENEFKKLVKEKIIPRVFLNAGQMKPVADFYGGKIEYRGIGFEGSPREVFWGGFIEPFLEDIFNWAFEFAVEHGKKRSEDHRELVLWTYECLLNGVQSVYKKMQNIDRRLRGKGCPDKIPGRDVSREIKKMVDKLNAYRDSTLVVSGAGAQDATISNQVPNNNGLNWTRIGVIFTILAGTVAILTFFNITPNNKRVANDMKISTNSIKHSNVTGDIVGRDKIIYQPIISVPANPINTDKQSKIRISKVKINRIIEDLLSGVTEIKKDFFEGSERIANDFSSRNLSSSGMHIKAQMDFAISQKGKVEKLLAKAHRDIEDVLLEDFSSIHLSEMGEFSEEHKRLSEFETSIPAVYKQLEEGVRSREARSFGVVKITKDFKL